MIVLTPPNKLPPSRGFAEHIDSMLQTRVFLAGSIEMGKAERWQDEVLKFLAPQKYREEIMVLNPRRDDWDPAWAQSKNNPQFRTQVEWEQDMMDISDVIFFYFAPGTTSPITLMELGQRLGESNLIVTCPEGFQRKGNVDIVCERAGIPVYPTFESGLMALHVELSRL